MKADYGNPVSRKSQWTHAHRRLPGRDRRCEDHRRDSALVPLPEPSRRAWRRKTPLRRFSDNRPWTAQDLRRPGGAEKLPSMAAASELFDSMATFHAGPNPDPVQNRSPIWVQFSDLTYVPRGAISRAAGLRQCHRLRRQRRRNRGGGMAGGKRPSKPYPSSESVLVAEEETRTLAIFEEPVIVTLRPNGGGAWCATTAPTTWTLSLVELSCEIPLASVWQIVYPGMETVEIRYVKLAVEINALPDLFAAHPDNARHDSRVAYLSSARASDACKPTPFPFAAAGEKKPPGVHRCSRPSWLG